MATIRLYLSSKQQKSNGKCEIYLRMSAARNKVFRAKSNLYVLPKYWDEKKDKDNDSTYSCKRARRFD